MIPRVGKTKRFLPLERKSIYGKIIELIVGSNLTTNQVCVKLRISKDTVSRALNKYFPVKGELTEIIVKQSKINEQESPAE